MSVKGSLRDLMLDKMGKKLTKRINKLKKNYVPDYGVRELDSDSVVNRFKDNSPRAGEIERMRKVIENLDKHKEDLKKMKKFSKKALKLSP